MIDVANITKYNCSHYELERLILFWILAAGKNGKTSAVCLEKLLDWSSYPFDKIISIGEHLLPQRMRDCGIGCFNNKANTIWQLVGLGLNLKTCSCEDLEQIKGIGFKTSRGFVVHSRKSSNYAVIDRHILKYLNGLGYSVPDNTPSNMKLYVKIEQLFLSLIPFGFTAAEFDLVTWNVYSGN